MKPKMSTKIFSIVYAACIVSCILLSAYLVSDVWARYFTEDTSTDGARVGKWDVTATVAAQQSNELYIPEGETAASYSFSVTSNSEVAVVYDVVIVFPENLPDTIALTLDGNQPTVTGTTYTFENVGDFPAGGGETQHILTVTATDPVYKVEQSGIAVKVVARQID